MPHRHLNHQRFTLAVIDDVISRGRWQDWVKLRQAALSDRALLDKVARVCRPTPTPSAITSSVPSKTNIDKRQRK